MNKVLTIAGPVLFITAIAAYWLFGPAALVRVLALGLVVTGVHSIYVREVPMGWEGRPASFHLRGPTALVVGFVAVVAGIVAIVFASATACAIGWNYQCSSSAP